MQRYIVMRSLQGILTLWVLSVVVFLSVHLTGDSALYLLGTNPVGGAEYEQLKKNLGLDRPLVVQYRSFAMNVVKGDFGRSHIMGREAREILFERLPATLQLAGMGFAIIVLVGLPLGILSAIKRGSLLDTFCKFFAILGMATPSFWIAIMLILLFGVVLGWLPTFGRGGIRHWVLPVIVLGWSGMAGMMRLTRSSMLEVLDSEYIKFARIKGLREWLVVYKHAAKNALIPVLTFAGLTLGGLLNGAVVVEVIFAWPGIGRLLLQGISQRDFPIVEATVLTAGFFYIVTALLVDILYAYVNPRIRHV